MTIKTYQQGGLDGLCGVYAIHNAIRHLLGVRTDANFDERLFRMTLEALPRGAYPQVLWQGMKIDRLLRTSKRVCAQIYERHPLEIKVERPFIDREFKSLSSYLDALDSINDKQYVAFILGLEWPREGGGHWTVYRGRRDGKLHLRDSGQMRHLPLRTVGLRESRAHKLCTEETVMFTLISADGEPLT